MVSAVCHTLALNYLPVPALGFFLWHRTLNPPNGPGEKEQIKDSERKYEAK